MIYRCWECGEEIALDSDWYPYCGEACEWTNDHRGGYEDDMEPTEDELERNDWDDVDNDWYDDGDLDPWGYNR
jgi:hypothetical protein